MDARGLLGHVERGADLAVRPPVGQQREHLALARREPERVFAGVRGGQRGRRRRLVGLQPQPRAQREALDLGRRASAAPISCAAASASQRARRRASRSPRGQQRLGLAPQRLRGAVGAPERLPGRDRRGPQGRVVLRPRRAASSARALARNAASTGRSPSAQASTRAISASAEPIANDGSSPRSRARTAASASTRVPVAATRAIRRDVLRAEVQPVQRVVDRLARGVEIARAPLELRAQRAERPDPLRFARVGGDVVGLVEQRARATSWSPRPSASSIRRSASLTKVVPIAGRPGDGSAASAAAQSPASKASSARSSISQRRGAPCSAACASPSSAIWRASAAGRRRTARRRG